MFLTSLTIDPAIHKLRGVYYLITYKINEYLQKKTIEYVIA